MALMLKSNAAHPVIVATLERMMDQIDTLPESTMKSTRLSQLIDLLDMMTGTGDQGLAMLLALTDSTLADSVYALIAQMIENDICDLALVTGLDIPTPGVLNLLSQSKFYVGEGLVQFVRSTWQKQEFHDFYQALLNSSMFGVDGIESLPVQKNIIYRLRVIYEIISDVNRIAYPNTLAAQGDWLNSDQLMLIEKIEILRFIVQSDRPRNGISRALIKALKQSQKSQNQSVVELSSILLNAFDSESSADLQPNFESVTQNVGGIDLNTPAVVDYHPVSVDHQLKSTPMIQWLLDPNTTILLP
jgi:hypothetical protein